MQLIMTIEGKKYRVDVEVEEGEEVRMAGMFPEPTATMQAHPVHPIIPPPVTGAGPAVSSEKVCRSPIAGVVFKIVAQVGQHLEVNDLLVVLEAMKMEQTISAPRQGVVAGINFQVGSLVGEGAELLTFREDEES